MSKDQSHPIMIYFTRSTRKVQSKVATNLP